MIEKIFLIGYRACGKTTVGRELAEKLGYSFLDTDQLITRKCDREIHEIVAGEGWDTFRRYEAEALLEASKGTRQVVATGGGAVMHSEIWRQLRGEAFIVWLVADIDTIAGRLGADKDCERGRPSLTGLAIDQEIESVLSQRVPLYRALADVQVDTGKVGTKEAVEIIVEAYMQRCAGGKE